MEKTLAEKLLNQNNTRIKYEYEGELPPWAIRMCEKQLNKKL